MASPTKNITATFDFGLKILSEPGFGSDLRTELVSGKGKVKEDGSQQLLWTDPVTKTIMMRPLQLDETWLDSTNAVPAIIRLAQMDVNANDLSSFSITEHPAFGNTATPWIFYRATATVGYFPGHPAPFPTVAEQIAGVDPGYSPSVMDASVIRPNRGFDLPTVMPPPPPAAAPGIVQSVDTTSGRFLTQTPLQSANQPLFLRWHQCADNLGFPPIYAFYVGQFLLIVKSAFVQILQDISAHGDRSAFKHVQTLPLFSTSPFSTQYVANNFQSLPTAQIPVEGEDRWLLWLPFRRNQVLLLTNKQNSALILTRPLPKRLPDNSDWDIVRADKISVWFLTPHWGRFQIQQVRYSTTLATCDFPPITLDFAPAVPPAFLINADVDHGTAISVTQSQPPSYALPINNSNDCPPIPAGIPSIQTRQYGFEAVFAASSDGHWTPFFYNLKVTSPPSLIPSTATPHVVNDTQAAPPSGSAVLSVEYTAGLNPGEGKATIHVSDFKTYDLNNFYYRSGNPVQVKIGTDPGFTGYTLPPGVEPLKQQDTHPRRIIFTASDRWWQLTKTYLRDNRDWTGAGHIDVVKTVMQEGGIDITGMDVPTATAMNNQPLGLVSPQEALANVAAIRTNGPWQPRPGETAASFIQRIARNFSTWVVGFQADGTPFYHPRYFYTTSELTLYENQAAATAASEADPRFYRRIVFSTIEPEANAILVKANSSEHSGPQYSSLYVDWASIRNPNVVNYLGRFKPETVEIFGSYSCQGINWAARSIWEQTRRRHVLARFECDYDPKIKVGHCLTLHGTPSNYGLYRVLSYQVKLDKQTWHHATVEAEYVETGVGLPTGSPT